jgi:hypothetical protein
MTKRRRTAAPRPDTVNGQIIEKKDVKKGMYSSNRRPQ